MKSEFPYIKKILSRKFNDEEFVSHLTHEVTFKTKTGDVKSGILVKKSDYFSSCFGIRFGSNIGLYNLYSENFIACVTCNKEAIDCTTTGEYKKLVKLLNFPILKLIKGGKS